MSVTQVHTYAPSQTEQNKRKAREGHTPGTGRPRKPRIDPWHILQKVLAFPAGLYGSVAAAGSLCAGTALKALIDVFFRAGNL